MRLLDLLEYFLKIGQFQKRQWKIFNIFERLNFPDFNSRLEFDKFSPSLKPSLTNICMVCPVNNSEISCHVNMKFGKTFTNYDIIRTDCEEVHN